MMAKALAAEGMDLTHIIGPKTEHKYEAKAKEEISRRIDSIVDVPFGAERHQDLKLSPEFTALKRSILERIRETSDIRTDLDQLEKLTRSTHA